MKKSGVFLFALISMFVLMTLSTGVMAGIPMEDEDEDYGDHGGYAYAYIYGEYTPQTKTFHNIQHDWDYNLPETTCAKADVTTSDSETNPSTDVKVWESDTCDPPEWELNCYAHAELTGF